MSVLHNIRVVMLNPLYSGNIGAVCRAMANMGLEELVLVAPNPVNMDEARMMACHATAILEGRRECPDLASAVGDCTAVVGTTARRGLYRQHALTARDWAARALEKASAGKVAVVFGREDNGLSNDEIALCTELVQIPAVEAFSSLNVSQAALICCYELFLAAQVYEPPAEKSAAAPFDLRERMFGLWQEMLRDIGFMDDATTGHMMHGIRRVLARGARTVDDVHILMGVARQAMWAAGDARNPEPDARTERCGDGGEAVDLAVVRRDGKTRET